VLISVRTATQVDATAAAQCLAALGFVVPAERIAAKLSSPAADVLSKTYVATDTATGAVLGVLGVHRIPMLHWAGDIARVTVLAVRVDAQRQGVGRALMAAAEDFAWSQHCERLEVVTGDHRIGAHAFYARLGYELRSKRFVKFSPKPAV
jgi:GNAT superfamily N-acetyltransferase